MKPYTENKQSQFKVGQTVRFFNHNHEIDSDVIRKCFWQESKCRPWGADRVFPALVLTKYSWIAESDVLGASQT